MQASIIAANLLASHADTLVAGFEGLRLTSYQDSNGIWTIGFGHTGPEVVRGLVWTRQQALDALKLNLLTADHDIIRDVKWPLNQNQFDSLVSFDYNIGEGHLRTSTTLTLLNQGNFQGAADAMLLWDKAAGAVSPGLLTRRTHERALFMTEVAA